MAVKVLISSYSSDIFTLNILTTNVATPVSLQLPVSYDPTSVIK